MRLFTTSFFLYISVIGYSCHESSVTLVSDPADAGGGNWTTTVSVCIGQTVNWGGTNDFTLTVTGANYVSYLPAALSNTYNAWIIGHCAGPNCFLDVCGSVTANATSGSTATVVTYTTSSSVPAGFTLVPDDLETCGINPISYCFDFTFVTDAYPASIILGGNTELTRITVCELTCGQPGEYDSPCDGTYEPGMTLPFVLLSLDLNYFNGEAIGDENVLIWETALKNEGNYFELERSEGDNDWDIIGRIELSEGTVGSSNNIRYNYRDDNFKNTINYYRLVQINMDGKHEVHEPISLDNRLKKEDLLMILNLLGQKVDENYTGTKVYLYKDGRVVRK